MSWERDFSKCPAGSQPFLAKRDVGKKVRYAVCTKVPGFYAGSTFVANCNIVGTGKGFMATHWRALPRDDERSDHALDVFRKALMDIASQSEPNARSHAKRALDEVKGFVPHSGGC
ncbi:MAG: hypothetical protein R3D70_05945 [Rhizobiaceae bacterium]